MRRRNMKKRNLYKIAVIDIETTGLDYKIDSIVEIGIVKLNLKTGETKIIFNSLVKESMFSEKYRNSWIFENSDITFEDVENAPEFNDFRQELQEIVDKYPVTAFNKSFDLGFLKIRDIKFPNELPCIMLTATDICKIPFPNGGNEYKFPKVQEAWDYFFPNTDYIEKHRAVDDAIHEAKIFFELFRRGLYKSFF